MVAIEYSKLRVAVLWSQGSSYLRGCIESLLDRGHQTLLSAFSPAAEAPYSADIISRRLDQNVILWPGGNIKVPRLEQALRDFNPDIVLISGWHHREYRKMALACRKANIPTVLCMDNPWEETRKQILGRLVSSFYVQPLFDAAFVGGERQAQFALRLGFPWSRIYEGVFTADERIFYSQASLESRQKRFIFVGRLAPEKGIVELLNAYDIYRDQSTDPWDLVIVGTGPLEHDIGNRAGVKITGFVQPNELNELLNSARCLVAPSLWEPWGVQIHEGASAGLPIICTAVCGSSVHLVRQGFNGITLGTGDVPALAEALLNVSSNTDLSSWSRASISLSRQFSREIWCETVESIYKNHGRKKASKLGQIFPHGRTSNQFKLQSKSPHV